MKRIAAAVLSVLLLATVMAHADGNAVKAEAVFKALRHLPQHQAGESNKIGPNLHGLFDREAGKEAGFNYSMGLSRLTKGIVKSQRVELSGPEEHAFNTSFDTHPSALIADNFRLWGLHMPIEVTEEIG